ncbi:MAG: terminase large subunit [Eubacteriales bacterium]|nr:terminase large subunit [Eubacteriales bacterium]MDD4711465.1 terminase large subunit [Eubacteriales bacterium]
MAHSNEKVRRVVDFIQCLKHTKGEFHSKPFTLLPWQKKIIRDVFGTVREDDPSMRQFTTAYIEIPKKQGKQLSLDTPIPTVIGWKTMGSIAIGDQVFDENGQACRVVGLSAVDSTEQCYRMTFRDGSHIDAGERHLWQVQATNNDHREHVWSTEDIYKRTVDYRMRHAGTPDAIRSTIRIPVAGPLSLAHRELPIDPYVYGYWLGNGNTVKPELTVRTCDVMSIRESIPYRVGSSWRQQGDGSEVLRVPALKTLLLKSFRDKAIRPEYLRASEAQRWALLQGLMDSDGSIGDRKAQSTYVSTIKGLAVTVRELLWSLGIKNAMTAEPSKRYSKPTEETLYTIRFTTFEDQPTARLRRKERRKRERVKETRSLFHYLRDIEPLPYPVPMRCIQVDSPSRLYLAGPSFVPTHNSELGAAIALNMLANDDEWKAEVYSCASDRQQAAIVFDVAVDMVKQSPALLKRIKIIPSMKRMVYQPTGSIYQVLSSEVATKHGLNVSACIFDELHTQPTRALYDVMTQGSGDARKQPLWFLLTTAGTDRNSICWEVHQKALDILEGRKADQRFYPVIFGLPEDADWTDEENWYKANPSIGHTITIDKVRDAFHKAQETPADENMFRQLRLNQWVKQSIRWMPMEKWDECGGVVEPYALEGRVCYAGLDLSSTSDLTTLILVFPPTNEEDSYAILPFFWLPEESLPLRVRRDHVMYDQWEKQGYIFTTEGNVVHYGFIEKFICDLGERYNIREIAYDRWNATMMVQTLQDDGFTMVPFGQGFRDMSPPTKELMRIVLERRLNHGRHPVLRWNMDNVFVRTDPAGNLKIDKEKSTEKVDGAVALVMALDRAMKSQDVGSVYDDDRGLIIISPD